MGSGISKKLRKTEEFPVLGAMLTQMSEKSGAVDFKTFVKIIYPESKSDNATEQAILREIFRLLDTNKNGLIDKNEIGRVKAMVSELSSKGANSLRLLDLVPLGDGTTAADSFASQKYEVTVLKAATQLYRAGSKDRSLGQYFTRTKPSSAAEVRTTCAVKDDWGSEGVTLHEVLVPKLDTLYTITVPAGTVLYEGAAAPLHTFMPVDALAAQVYHGGGHQLLIVAPWQLGGASWPCASEPLTQGPIWELLDYQPTPLCMAAFHGTLATAAGGIDPATVDTPSPRFGLTPLHHACISPHGAADSVRLLLQARADPARPNHMGLTPLILATIVGHVPVISLLYAAAPDTTSPGGGVGEGASAAPAVDAAEAQLGRGPLHFAAMHGRADAVEALLAAGAAAARRPSGGGEVDSPDSDDCAPLWYACRHGHAATAAALAAAGADVNRRGGRRRPTTPLEATVAGGHAAAAAVLLRSPGIARPPAPPTALILHAAVAAGRAELVRVLAELGPPAGLDPNAATPAAGGSGGDTALHLAAHRQDAACAEAVCAAGGALRLAQPSADGWTALHLAAERGDAAVVTAILAAARRTEQVRAVLAAALPDGATALVLAARTPAGAAAAAQCVRALLDGVPAGAADITARTDAGYTAVYAAAAAGHAAAVEALCAAAEVAAAGGGGAAAAVPDADGWTPLHVAAQRGHVDAVRALLRGGAPPAPAGGKPPPVRLAASEEVRKLLLAADPAAAGKKPAAAASSPGGKAGGGTTTRNKPAAATGKLKAAAAAAPAAGGAAGKSAGAPAAAAAKGAPAEHGAGRGASKPK